MAGVSTDTQPRAGRRDTNHDVNMIPMIDLLVCCISFLLITAVWSHMSRLPADALVAGDPSERPIEASNDRTLHVEVRSADSFTLVWRQGRTVISSVDVPRRPVEARVAGERQVRYPDLAARLKTEWESNGSHRARDDRKLDRAVLHTPDREQFGELVAVLDAVHSVRRGTGTSHDEAAFAVSFATE